MNNIKAEMDAYKIKQTIQFAKDMISQYEDDLELERYQCVKDALKAKIDTYKIILHLLGWEYE